MGHTQHHGWETHMFEYGESMKHWIDSFEWRTGVTPFTSVEFLVTAHAAYVTLAVTLSKFMRSYKGTLPGLQAYTFVHNVGMSVLSGSLLLMLVVAAMAQGRFDSIDVLSCNPPKPSVGLLPFTVYVFYLSKMLEFVDTFLLIGMRKRVAWLHVIHHSMTMSCVWHAMDSGLATEVVCTGLNCLVHVFMYLYFALPVRALRPVITLSQLLQFCVCLAAQCYALCMRYQLIMPSAPCSGTALADWHGFGMYLLFLVLFGHFFINHYVQSTKAHSPRQGPVTRSISARSSSPTAAFDLGPCAAGMDATGVDNPCGGGSGLAVSEELLEASLASALRMLSKALAFMAVGWLVMIYSPAYLTPVGVLITGISFSWFYTIGHDCSLGNFFSKQLSQHVGWHGATSRPVRHRRCVRSYDWLLRVRSCNPLCVCVHVGSDHCHQVVAAAIRRYASQCPLLWQGLASEQRPVILSYNFP